MINLKTFDSLKDFLIRDKVTPTLYPVRLINVDTISAWVDVKNFFAAQSIKGIFLSDFCEDDDTAPNLRRLYSRLKKENQSAYIVPLSEFLRLQPEVAVSELNKILDINSQRTKNFRLYFLMYRFRSVFQSLKITDPRKKDNVILLETEQADDYSLTIIQKFMNLKLVGNRADGFKKYLQYWEGTPDAPLNLYTDNAIYLHDKQFFDDVKVIVNAFDLLRHHYHLPTDLKRNFGNNEHWEKLSLLCDNEGNLNKVFYREFGTENFRINLFEHWNKNNFTRWLLWLWCKLQPFNSYVVHCALNSDSVEDFPAQIYSSIFDFIDDKNFDEIYNERKELLRLMKIQIPESFVEKVHQSDKKVALKILTDNSAQERHLIFETLQKFSYANYDKVLATLKKIYPALANYLSTIEIFSDEHKNYFRQYRWLKVTNNLTADFVKQVREIAERKGQGVYALKPRNQIVADEYSDDTAIYFVDAMGAEYLGYLAQDFSTLDAEKFSVNCQIGYCTLPTTTEFNKDFLANKNLVGETVELDEMKHSNTAYPENIINELNFLATLKGKILTELNRFNKIILCADHGTSRLAVISRKTKFDKTYSNAGQKVYNCGRFVDYLSNEKKIFSTAIHDGEKIILADYSRFIQQGTTGNEVHGGATLEEWLVPVITIERRTENSSRKKINPPSPKRKGISANKNFDI
ncbi:MAG: BREX-4 system phosphatase PglZ [Selenomonadaceae bacterium]|nr:BREX-4 system phosphatase PglZ [Selenomonadaceae bacterium]